jgi:hypothetical protein
VEAGVVAVAEWDLEVISCPLEHFDAIGFGARRVADFAVASAHENLSSHFGSAHGAGRTCVTVYEVPELLMALADLTAIVRFCSSSRIRRNSLTISRAISSFKSAPLRGDYNFSKGV